MMEFEFWWLLALPLFFGLGWAAARLDARQASRTAHHLPDAYFQGLNFLLNEQPDRAIDAFVDVVRLDPETIELHFALGNLFRRRGETDRAIRVHQSLASRNDLDAEQRARALYELGQDFLKAGLLDRAEDAFGRLDGTPYQSAALCHRLEIAQIVRDWPVAIALAQKQEVDPAGDAESDVCRGDIPGQIAHFHCELAAVALASGAPDAAQRAQRELDTALSIDARHPRAWLLRGEAAWAQRDAAGTIAALEHLSRASPAHLALAAPTWLAAHEAAGRLDAGIAALQAVDAREPSVDAAAAVADALARHDGAPAALRQAESALRQRPSLLGLERLLALRLSQAALPAERRAELELERQAIQAQVGRLSRYGCRHCGFQARRFHWQCPGCNRWDTYAPRRNEELDAAA